MRKTSLDLPISFMITAITPALGFIVREELPVLEKDATVGQSYDVRIHTLMLRAI